MPKKSTKPVKPVASPEKRPEPKAEPKRIIFRLYECVIHLEQAEKHLNGVGIFPTNIDATELNDAKEIIDGLRRQYVAAWNEMQKEAGL